MQAKIVAIILSSFAGAAAAQVGTSMGLLDANSATETELRAAPNVDAAVAAKIVASRPFASASALDELLAATLSEPQREQLYGRLFVTINLNDASRTEILLIPGVTDRLAHELRNTGPIRASSSFGARSASTCRPPKLRGSSSTCSCPMNLNDAPGAAFLTIPGMTARMVHEFEEYRPYTSFEQFRREIGKYVDQKEVARLERYLVIE